MSEKTHIPLKQAPPPPAMIMRRKILQREKIGDILSLGDKPAPRPAAIEGAVADQAGLEEKIIAALKTIYDPEIPLNIYDLGLIYKIALDATNAVEIEMTLTAPGCPGGGGYFCKSVRQKVEAIPEVPRVEVRLVWEPAWTRERLSEAARLDLGMM